MICTGHVAFTVLFSCLTCSALAGEFAYTCEIRHLYGPERDGSLKTFPESELEKIIKESSFAVSRETGALTGNSPSLGASAVEKMLRAAVIARIRGLTSANSGERKNRPGDSGEKTENGRVGAIKIAIFRGALMTLQRTSRQSVGTATGAGHRQRDVSRPSKSGGKREAFATYRPTIDPEACV